MACLKVQPGHSPGGTEENHEAFGLVGVPAEIKTRNLLNIRVCLSSNNLPIKYYLTGHFATKPKYTYCNPNSMAVTKLT
jgi:hypothetical protein